MKRLAFAAVPLLLPLVVAAAPASGGQIVECRDAMGRITLSNLPCPNQAPSQATDNTAPPSPAVQPAGQSPKPSDYSTPYGQWRGQAQFKETQAGKASGSALAVASLDFNIEAGGKIVGTSNETGCHLLGLARPGGGSTALGLDITVSGCSDEVFNRHFTGSLAVSPQQKHASLSLVTTPVLPKPVSTVDISATVRR